MQLKFGANHDGQTLQVRYALTNDTSDDLLVYHYVIQRPEVKPSCYIYHLQPDQVVLWAGSPPPPPLIMFAQPPTSAAQRLTPGESIDVLLRMELPLVETGIYNGHGGVTPVLADVIRFRLDVDIEPNELTTWELKWRRKNPGVREPPIVLEAAATVDPPITVHRREGFHRGGLDPMDRQFTPWK